MSATNTTWEKSGGKTYDSFLAELDRSGYVVTTATVMERNERGNPVKITVSVANKNSTVR
jgi:hypothetical protein